MLEIIRDRKLPIHKVVVASAQAVYNEGAALCEIHGHVAPSLRPAEPFRAGDFLVHCPQWGRSATSIPPPEGTPGGGETVYALTKVDQERLVLLLGETDWHSHLGVALFLYLWAQAVAVQSIYGSDCVNMAGCELKMAVAPPRVIIVLQTVLVLRALCEAVARR